MLNAVIREVEFQKVTPTSPTKYAMAYTSTSPSRSTDVFHMSYLHCLFQAGEENVFLCVCSDIWRDVLQMSLSAC